MAVYMPILYTSVSYIDCILIFFPLKTFLMFAVSEAERTGIN